MGQIGLHCTPSGMKQTPTTYGDALAAGWTRGREALTRCYISRKGDALQRPLAVTKRGEVYVLLPNWRSTNYSLRQYLNPPDDDPTGTQRR